MPAKSRRGGRKGKYSYQGKKQGVQTQPAVAPQSAAVVAEAASAPAGVATPRPAPVRQPRRGTETKPSTVRHDMVPREIATIGILAVIILAILFVLSRVLA